MSINYQCLQMKLALELPDILAPRARRVAHVVPALVCYVFKSHQTGTIKSETETIQRKKSTQNDLY